MPKNKWNIDKSRANELVYTNILSILKVNNNILCINELKKLLIIKTQDIDVTFNLKKKSLGNFIKKNYNQGIIDIIDNYSDIILIYKNNYIYVKYTPVDNDFLEWCIINDSEYL
jgi:hypothetical protein